MNSSLIETKVAAATGTGGLASIIVLALQLADPHLNINPALVSLIVTTLMGFAGYLAPHTSRTPAAPLSLTADEMEVVRLAASQILAQTKALVANPAQPSPSGTTTGPMA